MAFSGGMWELYPGNPVDDSEMVANPFEWWLRPVRNVDREFVRTTGVQDHRAAINAFEQGRRSVTDRDLQAYIDKTLPVLRQHLRDAETLAGTMAG